MELERYGRPTCVRPAATTRRPFVCVCVCVCVCLHGQVPIQREAFERDAFERVENDRHSSVQNSKYN